MGDRVEMVGRLAQWKIDKLGPSSYKKSEPFKVGIWNWYVLFNSEEQNLLRITHPLPDSFFESPMLAHPATFIFPLGSFHSLPASNAAVQEKLLRTLDDFVWPVDTTFVGRFIIDVEFLHLNVCPPNASELVSDCWCLTLDILFETQGGETSSVWPGEGNRQSIASQSSTLGIVSRMLDEAIHADLTIMTTDGTLRAHKAILSASSPVFQSMFHHNLKEKESSTIHIEDMSLESCTALLSYIYGTIKPEDFLKYRLALLGAANKYDIGGLKDICEENLLEDLNSGNVLEMLNEAWFYQLHKLKKGCLVFLFEFGKIHDIRNDEINNFFQHADRELMLEMFQEALSISNPV
ncbi:BTB/POZ domain-containing protein, partial [Mucuna pruriens]